MLGPRLTDIDLYDSPLASEAAQETYMSSFFQTEPLYQQFYTNQHIKPEDALSITEDMYECVEHPDSLEMTPGMYKQIFGYPRNQFLYIQFISFFFLKISIA